MSPVHTHALVIASGDVAPRARYAAAWPAWDRGVDLVIAADGGAANARIVGVRPDLVIGDLDSIPPDVLADVERQGVPVRRAAADKDESDTELAILAALEHGASRITVIGAFGGQRRDHELANLWLLAHPRLAGIEAALLDPTARIRLLRAEARPGSLRLAGRVGDVVTLLPFSDEVRGVTTRGLRYPLADATLIAGPARGLSNVREQARASVAITAGRLLVVESVGGGTPGPSILPA